MKTRRGSRQARGDRHAHTDAGTPHSKSIQVLGWTVSKSMAPRWYRRNQRAGVGSGTLRDAEESEIRMLSRAGASRLAPPGRTGQEHGRSRRGTAHEGHPRKRRAAGRRAGASGKGQGPEAGRWSVGRANPEGSQALCAIALPPARAAQAMPGERGCPEGSSCRPDARAVACWHQDRTTEATPDTRHRLRGSADCGHS